MIMAEMKKPRDTFVLGRGQYDNPKEKVTRERARLSAPHGAGLAHEPAGPRRSGS